MPVEEFCPETREAFAGTWGRCFLAFHQGQISVYFHRTGFLGSLQ